MADLSDASSSKIYQLAFRYLRKQESAEEITSGSSLQGLSPRSMRFAATRNLSSWIYPESRSLAMICLLRTARYQRHSPRTGGPPRPADEDGVAPSRTPSVPTGVDLADERPCALAAFFQPRFRRFSPCLLRGFTLSPYMLTAARRAFRRNAARC